MFSGPPAPRPSPSSPRGDPRPRALASKLWPPWGERGAAPWARGFTLTDTSEAVAPKNNRKTLLGVRLKEKLPRKCLGFAAGAPPRGRPRAPGDTSPATRGRQPFLARTPRSREQHERPAGERGRHGRATTWPHHGKSFGTTQRRGPFQHQL